MKTNIIKITQAKWESIPSAYKGVWLDYFGDHPEWKGKKIVMSGCINDDPAALGGLLVEGVHFIIEG